MEYGYLVCFLGMAAFICILNAISWGIKWKKQLSDENNHNLDIDTFNMSSAKSSKRAMVGSMRGLLLMIALLVVAYSNMEGFIRNIAVFLLIGYFVWTAYDWWISKRDDRVLKGKLKQINNR